MPAYTTVFGSGKARRVCVQTKENTIASFGWIAQKERASTESTDFTPLMPEKLLSATSIND
jgi:hypothetical protein